MIRGMTGYGRGEAAGEGIAVLVEMRTVNHRHLDVELRGTRLPAPLEVEVKKRVSERLSRGKCEALVTLDFTEPASLLRVNEALVRSWSQAITEMGRSLDLRGELRLEHLAQLPWSRAFDAVDPELDDEQVERVLAACEEALDGVVEVRSREGRELADDLHGRTRNLREQLALVRAATSRIAEAHHERLRTRLEQLVEDLEVDEQRLAQEAALLADRSDISEEVTRFEAYLDRLEELFEEDGPAGKRIDFTLQEAFRETNTMGSKCRGFDVSSAVIDMKTELERMREQAANVE